MTMLNPPITIDQRDINTIRKFLLDERRIREFVLSSDTQRRREKLDAVDDALGALRRLETTVKTIATD